jgi:hypothetical protein
MVASITGVIFSVCRTVIVNCYLGCETVQILDRYRYSIQCEGIFDRYRYSIQCKGIFDRYRYSIQCKGIFDRYRYSIQCIRLHNFRNVQTNTLLYLDPRVLQ